MGRSSIDILTEIKVTWRTDRQRGRDDILALGRLVREFLIARHWESIELIPEDTPPSGKSWGHIHELNRAKASREVCAMLDLEANRLNEYIATSAAAELLTGLYSPQELSAALGKLSWDVLRCFRTEVSRRPMWKDTDPTSVTSALPEQWELKPVPLGHLEASTVLHLAIKERWDRKRVMANLYNCRDPKAVKRRVASGKNGLPREAPTSVSRVADNGRKKGDLCMPNGVMAIREVAAIVRSGTVHDTAELILGLVAESPERERLSSLLQEQLRRNLELLGAGEKSLGRLPTCARVE